MDEDHSVATKPSAHKKRGQRLAYICWLVLPLMLLVAFLWLLYAKKSTTAVTKPLPVITAVSSSHDVPIYLSALGNVTPRYTVTVRTQINGQLLTVPFKEGQMIKKGDLLALVDPRPYEALLLQYEGDLKRDQALLANALIDLQRYQRLWKQDSISQQTLATQMSLVKQYEGAVKIDEGLIQGTKVNLIYCHITSPIDGRIGLRLVDPGNIVQTTDTNGIAVITSVNPITVIFVLAEDSVPEVMPKIYASKELPVEAFDRQQKNLLAKGTLYTVNNEIDTTTGTYRLRAVFDNKDYKLFPNQFVNIRLLVDTLRNATVVPTTAIQHTTNSDFIYIVNADNTVTAKTVILGPLSGDETVIQSGLRPGETVVVGGADKLKEGAKIVAVLDHKLLYTLQKPSSSYLTLHSFT